MSFLKELGFALPLDPLKAMLAVGHRLIGRRVRALNMLRQISSRSPGFYNRWIKDVERLEDVRAAAPFEIAAWPRRPRISVIAYGTTRDGQRLAPLIRSLQGQCYDIWELILVGPDPLPADLASVDRRVRYVSGNACSDVDILHVGLAEATGAFVTMVPSDTTFAPTALFEFVRAWRDRPDALILYGDEDEIDSWGHRLHPWFKPAWNEEMFLAQDYLSSACLVHTEAARQYWPLGPYARGAALYALVLAVAAAADGAVLHVPHVVAHMRRGEQRDDPTARLCVVAHHIASARATAAMGIAGTIVVEWPLPEPAPMVSIIIPTRDNGALLKRCLASIRTLTSYRNYDVIVVDNDSVAPDTTSFLTAIAAAGHARVIRYRGPFNYSAINNFAADGAQGEFLCLLNDDTEVIEADWLTAMVRFAVRPTIGAVGAKLLYPNRTIQHAGVVVGMGGAAGHAHRGLNDDDWGYFGNAHVTRYVSAVTGACLLVAKAKFAEVGGLDAENFKIAFNDIDLCLRLQQIGYRNVYVPRAVLFHHESVSRGSDLAPANLERYRDEMAAWQARWGTTFDDPWHHPHLDPKSEVYVIRL